MSGKRKTLNLRQKTEVIAMLNSGETCRSISKKFECGKTQIQWISANKNEILELWQSGASEKRKLIKRRTYTYEELNKRVKEWYMAQQANHITINGPQIQEKARSIAAELGHDKFSASNGWLVSLRLRLEDGEPREISEHLKNPSSKCINKPALKKLKKESSNNIAPTDTDYQPLQHSVRNVNKPYVNEECLLKMEVESTIDDESGVESLLSGEDCSKSYPKELTSRINSTPKTHNNAKETSNGSPDVRPEQDTSSQKALDCIRALVDFAIINRHHDLLKDCLQIQHKIIDIRVQEVMTCPEKTQE